VISSSYETVTSCTAPPSGTSWVRRHAGNNGGRQGGGDSVEPLPASPSSWVHNADFGDGPYSGVDDLPAAIGLGGGPSLSHHGGSLLRSPGMVAVFLLRVLFSGRLAGSCSTAGCLTRISPASGEQLLSFSSGNSSRAALELCCPTGRGTPRGGRRPQFQGAALVAGSSLATCTSATAPRGAHRRLTALADPPSTTLPTRAASSLRAPAGPGGEWPGSPGDSVAVDALAAPAGAAVPGLPRCRSRRDICRPGRARSVGVDSASGRGATRALPAGGGDAGTSPNCR